MLGSVRYRVVSESHRPARLTSGLPRSEFQTRRFPPGKPNGEAPVKVQLLVNGPDFGNNADLVIWACGLLISPTRLYRFQACFSANK